MPRIPTLVPRDDLERCVIQTWRKSSRSEKTIEVYLIWIRRYLSHWRSRGLDVVPRLTLREVLAFAHSYSGRRRGDRVKDESRRAARSAVHAWWCALKRLDLPVPEWHPPNAPRKSTALMTAYAEHRRCERGVAESTLARDIEIASSFVQALRSRGVGVARARVRDLDSFVDARSNRLGRRTIADQCSSLRAFLRFLRATGRIKRDLASCVVAPRYRTDERPPRALPWESIRRILRVIPREHAIGRRDFAMLLLMATYGLGAGETVRLKIADIDWRAGVLRARRPKTQVPLELPLLPSVGRALAVYLRHARPEGIKSPWLFVKSALPHDPVTSSTLRHQVRVHARAAGITDSVIGAHVFRHSHATRQIDAGVHPKIVSDILGHRRPSSTSVYVRVAVRRLRTCALPVPR